MTDETKEKLLKQAAAQSAIVAAGAAYGVATKHAFTPSAGRTLPFAGQVASAMGAAASNGAGVNGTIAAGTALVGAKVVAGAAIATAAAPFILGAAVIGVAGCGLYKLIEDA